MHFKWITIFNSILVLSVQSYRFPWLFHWTLHSIFRSVSFHVACSALNRSFHSLIVHASISMFNSNFLNAHFCFPCNVLFTCSYPPLHLALHFENVSLLPVQISFPDYVYDLMISHGISTEHVMLVHVLSIFHLIFQVQSPLSTPYLALFSIFFVLESRTLSWTPLRIRKWKESYKKEY